MKGLGSPMADTLTTLAPSTTDFSQGDSLPLIEEQLRQIGINDHGFALDAWQHWLNNPNGGEFMLWLRSTPTYQARFPYAAELRKRGIPFSEAGAINYERNVRQLFHMIGAPDGFATQDYINKLILNDVSYNELEQRVAGNYAEYLAAPQAIKDEFKAQLGDDSAVLAYYLDPQHTAQQFNEIKAKSLVRGFGKQFGVNLGDQAAQYAYGQSADQVQQEIANAARLQPLTRGTIDNAGITTDQQTRAAFLGDQTAVDRAVEARGAAFADAGGFTGGGARTGFGSARGA